jgi:hypothetical protein
VRLVSVVRPDERADQRVVRVDRAAAAPTTPWTSRCPSTQP